MPGELHKGIRVRCYIGVKTAMDHPLGIVA
jgi:hypothetical protein